MQVLVVIIILLLILIINVFGISIIYFTIQLYATRLFDKGSLMIQTGFQNFHVCRFVILYARTASPLLSEQRGGGLYGCVNA